MAKKVSAYKAVHLSVDCKHNDRVDIKCGGPAFLGFDFYVDPADVVKLTAHIKKELKANGTPLISICKEGERLVKGLWTRLMITAEIAKTTF